MLSCQSCNNKYLFYSINNLASRKIHIFKKYLIHTEWVLLLGRLSYNSILSIHKGSKVHDFAQRFSLSPKSEARRHSQAWQGPVFMVIWSANLNITISLACAPLQERSLVRLHPTKAGSVCGLNLKQLQMIFKF